MPNDITRSAIIKTMEAGEWFPPSPTWVRTVAVRHQRVCGISVSAVKSLAVDEIL